MFVFHLFVIIIIFNYNYIFFFKNYKFNCIIIIRFQSFNSVSEFQGLQRAPFTSIPSRLTHVSHDGMLGNGPVANLVFFFRVFSLLFFIFLVVFFSFVFSFSLLHRKRELGFRIQFCPSFRDCQINPKSLVLPPPPPPLPSFPPPPHSTLAGARRQAYRCGEGMTAKKQREHLVAGRSVAVASPAPSIGTRLGLVPR